MDMFGNRVTMATSERERVGVRKWTCVVVGVGGGGVSSYSLHLVVH